MKRLSLSTLSWKFGLLATIVGGAVLFAASANSDFGQASPVSMNATQQPPDDPAGNQQPNADEPPQIPEIKDEPRTVDPATLVPQVLAKRVTVDFSDSSLREVADWLQTEQGIVTLFDTNALAEAGIPQGEPVSDKLNDEPLYLMLNRLRSKELSWYMEDDILNITTLEMAETRATTKSYSVGDLLDAGYELDALIDAITSLTSEGWLDDGTGFGTLEPLGDILFVRQGEKQQREVAGILQALRDHARQTYSYDPPEHTAIRQQLGNNVSVDFDATPLITAAAELSAISGVDIRLDTNELRLAGVRDREPVTLQLEDRKLETVLQVLIAKLDLDWMLEDGVLWITPQESAEINLKTAFYDVRDLCQSEKESYALTEAIISQTDSAWLDEGTGEGIINFPQPGVMAIRNSEKLHSEISQLLAMYRQALANSTPREGAVDPSQEVIVHYYRLPDNVARDMTTYLPRFVGPESWGTGDDKEHPGRLERMESPPELIDSKGKAVVNGRGGDTSAMIVPQQILRITQTRENHIEIAKFLKQIRTGDEPSLGGGFGGGGLGGGGGFGSGYFKPSPRPRP